MGLATLALKNIHGHNEIWKDIPFKHRKLLDNYLKYFSSVKMFLVQYLFVLVIFLSKKISVTSGAQIFV